MSFRLSAAAEEDIIAIAGQGVRTFGAGQAKRYHDELFAVIGLREKPGQWNLKHHQD